MKNLAQLKNLASKIKPRPTKSTSKNLKTAFWNEDDASNYVEAIKTTLKDFLPTQNNN
jgi:hypothetical protein